MEPQLAAELAVDALGNGDWDGYGCLVQELELSLPSEEVTLYLAEAGASLAYMRLADEAARRRDSDAASRFARCALRYADPASLIETGLQHNLGYIVVSGKRCHASFA